MKIDDSQIAELLNHLVRLPQQFRIAIGFGIFLVVHVLCYFLMWSSMIVEIETSEQSINAGVTSLQADSKKLLERPKYDLELKRLKAILPELQRALPQEKEIPPLLSKINEVIRRNQLKLVEFVPQQTVNQDVMIMIPVKLSVVGDGVSIAKLPAVITSLSRKVTLSSFVISQNADGSKWTLNGELRAYAQQPALNTPDPTKAPANLAEGTPGSTINMQPPGTSR